MVGCLQKAKNGLSIDRLIAVSSKVPLYPREALE